MSKTDNRDKLSAYLGKAILVIALYYSQCLFAEVKIAIISPSNTSLYTETILGISDNLNPDISIKSYYLDQQSVQKISSELENIAYIVTIGEISTVEFINKTKLPTPPIISILISPSAIDSEENPLMTKSTGVLLADQNTHRILSILLSILPNVQSIGLVTSQQSDNELTDLIADIQDSKLIVVHKQLADINDLAKVFTAVSNDVDVILATTDQKVYNTKNIKRILMHTYRNNTPIFGYSQAITKAGALASVYTPPYYIGKETAEIINLAIDRNKQPDKFLKHPKYYKVSINAQAADTLGISVKNNLFTDAIQQDN